MNQEENRTIKYIEEMLRQMDKRKLRLVYAFILHLTK